MTFDTEYREKGNKRKTEVRGRMNIKNCFSFLTFERVGKSTLSSLERAFKRFQAFFSPSHLMASVG